MGTLYEFRCPKCEYRAEVSGGYDFGMAASTTTICCEQCQQLYDMVVCEARWMGEPTEAEVIAKLRCPKRAKHRVHRWEAGGPCPKCDGPMENKGETLLWD